MFQFSSLLRRAFLLSMPALFLLVIPGCGSKVTAENYAKIQPGQTEAEVIAVLGKPTSTENTNSFLGNGSKEIWKDGDKVITIGLLNGKVMVSDKSGF